MKNWKQTVGMIFGPTGAFLVASGYTLEPNIIWLISNIVVASYFYQQKEKELLIMYLIYIAIAVYGVFNLGIRPLL